MITYTLYLSLFILVSPIILSAQSDPPANDAAFTDKYEWRVRQQRLYGVYIPADLGEAFVQLNQKSTSEGRTNFKSLSEKEAVTRPFFGLGRWIGINWGFYGGSRLTVYLNQIGLHHPDDMIRFMLVMYHRHLNEVPLNPKPVVEGLLEIRRKAETEKLKDAQILYEETRKREIESGLENKNSDGGKK